ncbi:uncharacterized protein LTHEOB_5939 [Lasiodiplodia theobromae]|uniref:uncharacterized protein n=1 Tax=Lasiodiplodia theobromae TaxID=45133 RepID=UPI0015C389C1|nr:uncharacterized protein LTHEOB_5939 [Lasiodiplodia theobromae]KAF4544930.1 hypothetical protein LTHEOB_5939 [Lasiodiplodia theobromae]
MDDNRIIANDLIYVRQDAVKALFKRGVRSADFRLLYNVDDSIAALATYRNVRIEVEPLIEDVLRAAQVLPNSSILPRANAGPWVPRMVKKTDLEAVIANAMNSQTTRAMTDVFDWDFPDRTIEVLTLWHTGEKYRLRSIGRALLEDERAARYSDDRDIGFAIDPKMPERALLKHSALSVLRPSWLHAHEVRGTNGFALLHPMPIFVRGERWQHVRTGPNNEITVHDQLAQLVLYYVDDMDRSYLDEERRRGMNAYLSARQDVLSDINSDIGLEGMDGDEWEEIESHNNDSSSLLKPPAARKAGASWHDAVSSAAISVFVEEIQHPDATSVIARESWDELNQRLQECRGIPAVLDGPRVKKLIHPDLLDPQKRDAIDFADGDTVRKYNRWVVDFLSGHGVAFDAKMTVPERKSLARLSAMPIPVDTYNAVPAALGLSPLESKLVATLRKHPEEVAAMFTGSMTDKSLLEDAVALAECRALSWDEMAVQFNSLWHGAVTDSDEKHFGLAIRPEMDVEAIKNSVKAGEAIA